MSKLKTMPQHGGSIIHFITITLLAHSANGNIRQFLSNCPLSLSLLQSIYSRNIINCKGSIIQLDLRLQPVTSQDLTLRQQPKCANLMETFFNVSPV